VASCRRGPCHRGQQGQAHSGRAVAISSSSWCPSSRCGADAAPGQTAAAGAHATEAGTWAEPAAVGVHTGGSRPKAKGCKGQGAEPAGGQAAAGAGGYCSSTLVVAVQHLG